MQEILFIQTVEFRHLKSLDSLHYSNSLLTRCVEYKHLRELIFSHFIIYEATKNWSIGKKKQINLAKFNYFLQAEIRNYEQIY